VCECWGQWTDHRMRCMPCAMVVNEYQRQHDLELHLLNVQRPFSRHVARFVARRDRATFHHEQADKALLEARRSSTRCRCV